jgi:hypothetical protein
VVEVLVTGGDPVEWLKSKWIEFNTVLSYNAKKFVIGAFVVGLAIGYVL